jgi:hypothetical protein
MNDLIDQVNILHPQAYRFCIARTCRKNKIEKRVVMAVLQISALAESVGSNSLQNSLDFFIRKWFPISLLCGSGFSSEHIFKRIARRNSMFVCPLEETFKKCKPSVIGFRAKRFFVEMSNNSGFVKVIPPAHHIPDGIVIDIPFAIHIPVILHPLFKMLNQRFGDGGSFLQ